MRFLCLPGAYANTKNWRVQLAPFVDHITSEKIEFIFTQGTIPCAPPKGFVEYFGPAPHFRFLSYDGVDEEEDVLEKIRDMPDATTAEDALRLILPTAVADVTKSMRLALDALYETMERDGPFDGIIGYSEGATVASTLVLDEKRRFEEEGRERMIKCAVFFCGWPPIKPDDGGIVLSDESDTLIDIPTCHVVGADDPYFHGSMALYNVCEEDTAIFFDHGKGHTLPRDARTLEELETVINNLVTSVC